MGRQSHSRSRWLIDTELQVGLGIRLALCMAGYVALFLLVALIDPIVVLLSGSATEGAREAAFHDLTTFLRANVGPLLFATACMILHAVIILHRLAGPVLRFRTSYEDVTGGNLTSPISLRDGDLLKSLADDHNRAIAALAGDLGIVRDQVEALTDAIRDESVLEEVRRRKVDSGLQKLEAVVGRYRIETPSTDSAEPRREESVSVDA